jgi:sugar diacid utilization regulator
LAATFWSLRLLGGELVVGRSRVPIERFLDGLKTTVFLDDRSDIDRVGAGTLAVGLGRIAGKTYQTVDRFASKLANQGAVGLLVHQRSLDLTSPKPGASAGTFPVLEVPAKLDWPDVLQHILRIDSVLKDRVGNPEKRRRELMLKIVRGYGHVDIGPEDALTMGVDLAKPLRAVVIAPPPGTLTGPNARKLEETVAIEAMESDPLATVFSWKEVVVVVGGNEEFDPGSSRTISRMLFKARKALAGVPSVAGVGKAYAGAEGIFRSFREARWAGRVGQYVDPDRDIVTYADIGSYAWLEPIDLIINGEAVAEVMRIIEHDRANGTRLLETLQAYLETRRSREAAARLFVHRNTLRYRLDSIKRLIGMDIQEHEARLIMELQLRLARVRGLLPESEIRPFPSDWEAEDAAVEQ